MPEQPATPADFVLSRAWLRPLDLEGWLHQNTQALESPPVAVAARSA